MNWSRFAENRDRVRSSAGGWTFDGNASLYGYDIHQELVPKLSWMQTIILSVTNRLYSANQARLVEAMFVVTGYPDPRLWCNRVVAFAGTARCPAAASLSAGIASAEARLFGRQADYKAAKTIQKAHHILNEKGEMAMHTYIEEMLKKNRVVYGFGRPLTKIEERNEPIDKMAQILGINDGPHLTTAKNIEKFLKKWRIIMNYGGYITARLLDLDFKPIEIYRLLILIFYTGLVPCYTDAFESDSGTFLPIACEDILYEGIPERRLPSNLDKKNNFIETD